MRPIEIGLLVGLALLIFMAVFLLLRRAGRICWRRTWNAPRGADRPDAGLSTQSDRMQVAALQIAQAERLAETRETVTGQFGQFQTAMLEKLIEQGRAEQSLLQDTLKGMTAHFNERVQLLSQTSTGG
jgi:DNA recombination protein RmuC